MGGNSSTSKELGAGSSSKGGWAQSVVGQSTQTGRQGPAAAVRCYRGAAGVANVGLAPHPQQLVSQV
jgi:hypothetical protein